MLNLKRWQENSSAPVSLYSNQAMKSNVLNLISIVKKDERLGFIFTDRAILSRVNSGTLIFPFNEFKIDKEDPVSKSETRSKYRNFYQLGFMDFTLYFYDRVRLIFLSLT
jgi:hypothetical protein